MQITIQGNELYHHGIKGQKWGERRWQNQDGSLTPAGRVHYGYGEAKNKFKRAAYNAAGKVGKGVKAVNNVSKSVKKKLNDKDTQEKIKKAAKIGAAVIGTGLAIYGGYKLSEGLKSMATEDAKLQAKNMVNNFLDDKHSSFSFIEDSIKRDENKLLKARTNHAYRTLDNAAYQYNSDGIKYVGRSVSSVYKDTKNKAYNDNLKHPIKLVKRTIKNNKNPKLNFGMDTDLAERTNRYTRELREKTLK